LLTLIFRFWQEGVVVVEAESLLLMGLNPLVVEVVAHNLFDLIYYYS